MEQTHFQSHTQFPSLFDIGDPVFIKINDTEIAGHVRTVIFTTGKIRYSIFVIVNDIGNENTRTTFHNIDSCFVVKREGEKIELDFDNYS